MSIRRELVAAAVLVTPLLAVTCGGYGATPVPPAAPTPPNGFVTANAYILPGSTNLGSLAFGDAPVVVYGGERLRWVNIDDVTHALVADTPGATDFRETRALGSGGEQSLVMTKLGITTFHCSIHPAMVGTLIVRRR